VRRILFFALVLTVAATAATAEDNLAWSVSLFTGANFPVTPESFTDVWMTGFTAGAGAAVKVHPKVAITGSVDYSRMGFDSGVLTRSSPDATIDGDGDASVIYASVGAKVYPVGETNREVRPYIVGGLGIYRLSASEVSAYNAEFRVIGSLLERDENTLGLHVGAGVDLWTLCVEATYLYAFTEDEGTGHVPVRVGIVIDI
jgi:opacity protein-like surface antigen